MSKELIKNRPTAPEITLRKLNLLLEQYKHILGPVTIVPIAEAGFLLQLEKQSQTNQETNLSERASSQSALNQGDWLLFDYDDTLGETNSSKKKLKQLLASYLQDYLSLTAEQSEMLSQNLFAITYSFSMWAEKNENLRQYYFNAHIASLNWAIKFLKSQLQTIPHSLQIQEILDQNLLIIKEKLALVKSQLVTDDALDQIHQDIPFYFKAGKLILKSKKPWSEEVEQIFRQSILNPSFYSEILNPIKNSSQDDAQNPKLVIFTFSEAYLQLLKVINLIEKNPGLNISQIWLTQVKKGEFLQALFETYSKLSRSIKKSIDSPFGTDVHTIILFDDETKHLNNFLLAQSCLTEQNLDTKLMAVRIRHPGTKRFKEEWSPT